VRVGGLGGSRPDPDDLLADLARWSAADRAARAASGRARVRALVDQSAASATWAGLLVDLAEAGAEVVCSLAGGTRVSGRLVGMGRDFAVVERAGARPVLVRTDAITSLAPGAGSGAGAPGAGPGAAPGRPGGQRRPPRDLNLAAALDALAGEGAPVVLRAAGEAITGTVTACGVDMVTLRSEGAARRTVHVPLGAVVCVELR
jgi:hypothetical protein